MVKNALTACGCRGEKDITLLVNDGEMPEGGEVGVTVGRGVQEREL
jgi:hypothetical protein